jgi:hypothetical protein
MGDNDQMDYRPAGAESVRLVQDSQTSLLKDPQPTYSADFAPVRRRRPYRKITVLWIKTQLRSAYRAGKLGGWVTAWRN